MLWVRLIIRLSGTIVSFGVRMDRAIVGEWSDVFECIQLLVTYGGSRNALASAIVPHLRSRSVEAAVTLAAMYQFGDIVRADFGKAIQLYSWASKRGYGLASHNMAGLFVVLGDMNRAREMYELAHSQDPKLAIPKM